MMAFGLGVGEAGALKAQRGDEIVARPKLVLALSDDGLDPEKFLAPELGNGPHTVSLGARLPR